MAKTDPRAADVEAVTALREALLEVRGALRASEVDGDGEHPPEAVSLPSLVRLVDAFDRLGFEPQALELAFGGAGPRRTIDARSFGIPGLLDVEADEDGWSVSTPVGKVSSGDEGISIETPQGSATFDGSSGKVETSFGSVDVDSGGVRVTTPWGSTRVGPDGRVTITDGDGKPVDVPLPGLPGGNGGFRGVPLEIPIPIPTFKVQPLEIPIPVPRFEAEPLRLKVPVPELEARPFALPAQLPWSGFGAPPWLDWLAGFPDVAWTPTPAGPVPIPYPQVGQAGGLPPVVGMALRSAVQTLYAMQGAFGQALEHARGALSAIPWLEPPAPWVPQIGHAVGRAVARWMPGVHVANAQVQCVTLLIPPGGWRSDVDFRSTLDAELAAAGVPDAWAGPVGKVLARAFDAWFSGGMGAGLPLYPAFAAYPAPHAPPMPNIPVPLLALCASAELEGLLPPSLESALRSELTGAAERDKVEAAARQLARWFSERFILWATSVQVMNLLGTGPVPSFAPPSVPVGPVVGGSVLPTRGILVGGNAFATQMPWAGPSPT